jgi:hypothetical protein
MYIYPLSKIHNTSLVSAYFSLDKRECECLEYILRKKQSVLIIHNACSSILALMHLQ